MKKIFAFTVVAFVVACSTVRVPTVPPERFDLASDACSKLRAWGCAVGHNHHCEAAFRLPPNFGLDPACVLGAADVSVLTRECNVRCEIAR